MFDDEKECSWDEVAEIKKINLEIFQSASTATEILVPINYDPKISNMIDK